MSGPQSVEWGVRPVTQMTRRRTGWRRGWPASTGSPGEVEGMRRSQRRCGHRPSSERRLTMTAPVQRPRATVARGAVCVRRGPAPAGAVVRARGTSLLFDHLSTVMTCRSRADGSFPRETADVRGPWPRPIRIRQPRSSTGWNRTRLAEVRVARGDHAEATRLLQRALRWPGGRRSPST